MLAKCVLYVFVRGRVLKTGAEVAYDTTKTASAIIINCLFFTT